LFGTIDRNHDGNRKLGRHEFNLLEMIADDSPRLIRTQTHSQIVTPRQRCFIAQLLLLQLYRQSGLRDGLFLPAEPAIQRCVVRRGGSLAERPAGHWSSTQETDCETLIRA
ncbi:MAG: hypothetical protein WCC31_21375, partial [Terracidiphilus sp.]